MAILNKLDKLTQTQAIILIILVGFIVYFNSLFNGFVWDDEEQIVNNTLIQNLTNFPLLLTSSTFNGGGAAPTGWFYRPMMTSLYLINWNIWGDRAFGFHLFQVSIHLLNASLIFLLFCQLFKLEKIKQVRLISFLIALIFVVHPGNVEAVAYIAALQESLYTFFALSIFIYLLRPRINLGLGDWGVLGGLGLLGMLSKESGIILIPLVFIFLAFYQRKNIGKWFVCSSLVVLFYFFLRLGVAKIPLTSVNIGPVAESSLWERLATIPYALGSYFKIIFFPKDLFISQHSLVTSVSDFRFWGYLGILGVLGISWVWLGMRLKSKLFFFFLFWFLGGLSLVLNIIPLDMSVAERWLYFPLIGFLGMAGVVLERSEPVKKLGHLGPAIFLGVFMLLGIRTAVRNADWYNGLTLYGNDIKINQNAFDLENNYGVELFRRGRIDQAKGHFEKSIYLYPRWWFAYNNLGAVYQRSGDFEKAEEYYLKSINISDYYLAYENYGFILLRQKKYPQAQTFLERAVGKFPLNSRIRTAYTLSLYFQGKQQEAEAFALKTYLLLPTRENKEFHELIKGKKRIDL